MFAIRAQQHPARIAVVCGLDSLSYRELAERATLLCKYLKEKDIGPGSRIGVLLRRSIDSFVAMLAVVKAGAGYIPLDSEYPQQALSRMIEEARIDLFLTHSGLEKYLSLSETQEIVNLDLGWEDAVRKHHKSQATLVNDKDIAYIMFTSGTTGVPKAVAVTYGSLNLYLASMLEELNITGDDVYLNSASFSFSASTRQTFLPMYCGSTVVLADEQQQRNQRELLTLIKMQKVTVWDTVPTSMRFCIDYLRDIVAESRAALLSNNLRLILTTGEPLQWDIPDTWANEFGHGAKLLNLYSQTETSGTVCTFDINGKSVIQGGYVPLGRPVRNTPVYVLDEAMNLLSRGEIGELYVGGDQVALGYINDPRLSGQTFISDPFSSDVNARLYKTGDLVYELPDGNIQTVGRSDSRVKFNGYRIELSEIETLLETCDEVQEAAVVVNDVDSYKMRLVGYVVPKPGRHITTHELREYLQDKLPRYMIPTAYAQMSELPLTESGKLDRRLLSSFAGIEENPYDNKQTAPRNEREAEILDIWKEVLEIDSLGTEENFFELGGHSLHATRIFYRIQEKYGDRIALSDLFEHPTVQALATSIEGRN